MAFDAMKEVNRPEGSESWEFYDSSKEVAWKTGTSFGNKDAWAIGVTPDYVVGVWSGNADGEGRPNHTGVSSSAPILFDVFYVLPKSDWFSKPLDEFVDTKVCSKRGYLATPICPETTISVPNKDNKIEACNYHTAIQLDAKKQFRLDSSCADLSTTITEPWFVLPPLMEYYCKKSHLNYKALPNFARGCNATNASPMEFIYPKNGSRIILAKCFNGEEGELILKLVHTKQEIPVYWYLDEKFIKEPPIFMKWVYNRKKENTKLQF